MTAEIQTLTTHVMKRFSILIAFCTVAGCQQARSFLHMDSNSPTPFMGLELSVDASEGQNAEPAATFRANDSRLPPETFELPPSDI